MHKHSQSNQKHANYYQAIIQLRPAEDKLVNYTLD